MGKFFAAVGNGVSGCMCTCALTRTQYQMFMHVKTSVKRAMHRYILTDHFEGRSVYDTISAHIHV